MQSELFSSFSKISSSFSKLLFRAALCPYCHYFDVFRINKFKLRSPTESELRELPKVRAEYAMTSTHEKITPQIEKKAGVEWRSLMLSNLSLQY